MVDLGTNVDEFEVSQDEVVFWDKASLEKWVRSEKDQCFVAEMDGDIIGFILSHIHNPTGKVEIENVYIKEEFRREGNVTVTKISAIPHRLVLFSNSFILQESLKT